MNLRWNSSEYGGVRDLRIPPHRLWKPDVLMYNRWVQCLSVNNNKQVIKRPFMSADESYRINSPTKTYIFRKKCTNTNKHTYIHTKEHSNKLALSIIFLAWPQTIKKLLHVLVALANAVCAICRAAFSASVTNPPGATIIPLKSLFHIFLEAYSRPTPVNAGHYNNFCSTLSCFGCLVYLWVRLCNFICI